MKIAICDDNEKHLKRLETLTKSYLTKNNIDAKIVNFRHGDHLLEIVEKENFQIYLLDIVMPMVNGLEIGKAIRNFDREAQIIYTTTAPEYALESFSVSPLNYLLKPINKDQFFETLNLAIEKINANEQTVTIKSKEGLHTISIYSIICCEYVNHFVKYILVNGDVIETTTIKGSFSEYIIPLLMDKRFIQPHSSYVVNMSRVERLSREGFLMCGGVFVPISGKLFTEVKKQYLCYRLQDEVRING